MLEFLPRLSAFMRLAPWRAVSLEALLLRAYGQLRQACHEFEPSGKPASESGAAGMVRPGEESEKIWKALNTAMGMKPDQVARSW